MWKLNEGERMFLRNEFKAINSGGWTKRLTLPGFVFLAMLGVSFATGGLSFLSERMDDPFVRWVDFPVTTKLSDDEVYDQAKDSLEHWTEQRRWALGGLTGYYRFSTTVHGAYDTKEGVIGRTIMPLQDTVLLNNILSNQLVLDFRDSLLAAKRGNVAAMWADGVILQEDLYRELFGSERQPRQVVLTRSKYLSPVLNIIAVVKRLPSRSSFLVNSEFQRSFTSDEGLQYDSTIDSLAMWVRTGLGPSDLQASKDALFGTRDARNFSRIELHPLLAEGPPTHRNRITIHLKEAAQLGDRRQLFKRVREEIASADPIMEADGSFLRPGDGPDRGNGRDKFHNFSLKFNALDSVQQVSEVLASEPLGVELDLSKVESLKNFNIVAVLTNILAVMLLIFAVAAVAIFINNLVQSHLDHIKQNLGTFRAFGITKAFLVRAYAFIIARLLLTAVGIAGALLLCLNAIGILGLMLSALKVSDSVAGLSLDVFSLNVALLVVVLFIVALAAAVRSTSKVLKAPPGDLIYNRV